MVIAATAGSMRRRYGVSAPLNSEEFTCRCSLSSLGGGGRTIVATNDYQPLPCAGEGSSFGRANELGSVTPRVRGRSAMNVSD